MSLFDKLILGVCLPHPVFLSDVLSDVIDVISIDSADSPIAKAILPWLTTAVHVSFLRQKMWDITSCAVAPALCYRRPAKSMGNGEF